MHHLHRVDLKRKVLRADIGENGFADLLHQIRQAECFGFQLKIPGFDLADIQDLIKR